MTTATLHDYFRTEARAYLDRMDALLRADPGLTDSSALRGLARGLRGTAQLAREDIVFRTACLLEGAAQTLHNGDLTWSSDVRERIERTLVDLDVMLAGTEGAEGGAHRLEEAVQRWAALDVRAWTPGIGAPDGERRETPAFREFAAAELEAMIEVLGTSLDTLARDPMDREALKQILRRQRNLLGAARLDELPTVAETLRAIEDVSRIIARMNVPIKDEWLDVFRCARMVLETTAPAIGQGESPPHTPALSRLRTYRQELLDRYGSVEEPAAPGSPAEELLHARPSAARAHDAQEPDPSVDIQNLMYTGEAALRRALDLRARLERAVEHDPDALALVDEVFDLIRLGLQ